MPEFGTSGTASAPSVDQQGQQIPPPQGQYPPPPQGQYPPPPPVWQYAPPTAPPARELRIPLTHLPSLMKVAVLCLCAGGLVAALVAPWVHLEMDTGDGQISANYDGKLQRMDSPSEADGAPDDLGGTLDDAGYDAVGAYYDRGLAVTGFILVLIIACAGIFLRLVDVLPPRVSVAVQVALAGVVLLPATMAAVAGMRFVGGFGIAWDSLMGALDVDASISALGGLLVALIGIILILLLVLELLRELRAASPLVAAGPMPWSGPPAQRVMLLLVVLAIAGIVAVPVTPWARVDPDDEEMGAWYQDAGLIRAQAEAGDSAQDALRDASRDIRYTSALFWLALVFSIVCAMALALRGLGAPRPLTTGVTLAGAMLFLFPLLGLLSQVGFMGHLKDVEIALGEGELAFFAYAPFILGFLLLLVALMHLGGVARDLRGGPRTQVAAPPPAHPAQAYGQWPQPATAPQPVVVELAPPPQAVAAGAEMAKGEGAKQGGGDVA